MGRCIAIQLSLWEVECATVGDGVRGYGSVSLIVVR